MFLCERKGRTVPRAKGTKDTTRRKMNPNSLKALRDSRKVEGWANSDSTRPYGPKNIIEWWNSLSPAQRGAMLVILHYEVHRLTPDDLVMHPALQSLGAEALNKLFGRKV